MRDEVPLIVVFIGPPGSGKSTQAELLSRQCRIPHLEMGEILRDWATQDTPLGRQIKSYVDRGLLVPESMVRQLVEQRLRSPEFRRGFVIDGFPRNLAQARMLDEMLAEAYQKVDAAVLFDAPERIVLERLSGRRLCPRCGASYHLKYAPPVHDEVCDRCGEKLRQRVDDRPEVIRSRLRVFAQETAPLIEYYRAQGILHRIDASRGAEQIYADLKSEMSCG